MSKKHKPAEAQPEWPFLDDTPPEVQLKRLEDYYAGRGPHINYTNSILSKVASEVFRKARLRKVN